MMVVAVICGLLTVALSVGGAFETDGWFLLVMAFPAIGCAFEAFRMRRELRARKAVLAAGRKEIHQTVVERVSFNGGTTNPHVNLTLQGFGTLLYRGVPGLPLLSAHMLKEGMKVRVHIGGDPVLFLHMAADPPIDDFNASKPGQPQRSRAKHRALKNPPPGVTEAAALGGSSSKPAADRRP